MLNVAIVGGGIHGIAAAVALSRISIKNWAIIDSKPLLSNWIRATASIGQTHMRSPWTHYPDGNDSKLQTSYRHRGKYLDAAPATPPMRVFNRYCRTLVSDHKLEQYRIGSQVSLIYRVRDKYFIDFQDSGQGIVAKNVIFSTGLGMPNLPSMAGISDNRLSHSCQIDIRERKWRVSPKRILVIGGGLTAATLAVNLAKKGHFVTMAIRDQLNVSPFDFDPAWFGGDLYKSFRASNDPYNRSEILKNVNIRGSVTPTMVSEMEKLKGKNLKVKEHTPIEALQTPFTDRIMSYTRWGMVESSDRVIMATGFKCGISRTSCLRELQNEITSVGDLPVLGLHSESVSLPGFYVSGSLGRLGNGPAASNVYGAYLTSNQIASDLFHRGFHQ